jgi:RNA polymerase sigma factor (sigma-70 family)
MESEIENLYKKHFGKLVAALVYSSKDIDLAGAEDIVHDSFSAALIDWKAKGIPLNPAGWLFRVCRNKALNKISRDKHTEPITERTGHTLVETRFSESILDDQQLKLLFACAHPDLSPKVQVAITLKYVANFRVEAIASTLAMTVDGIDKLLVRARQKIQSEKILLEEPNSRALTPRIRIVLKIIYLIFNEGYKAAAGKEILREELCEEALILNKSLMDVGLGDSEALALHALMLFNIARMRSRVGESGELLDLENQDRSKWNRDLILLANDFLKRSRSEQLSSYHIQASIAYMHCAAESFAVTDWKTISQLYARLLHENPNPFVELNLAIALYYAGQKSRAFDILHALQKNQFMNHYYLLNSALGKLYYLEGESARAVVFLKKAYLQATFIKEKDFIRGMLFKAGHTEVPE